MGIDGKNFFFEGVLGVGGGVDIGEVYVGGNSRVVNL